MKKILLVDTKYKEGGPKTVHQNILNSYLSKKYEIKEIGISDSVLHFNPIKGIKFILAYWKLINAEHADVALVRGLQYIGFLMVLAAKLSNVKKIIVCVHGSDWDVPERTFRKIILKYIIEPLEIRMADSIFTVCQAEQKIVKPLKLAKAGANKGVIYNTFPNVDINKISSGKLRKELNIPENKIIVISVGRVVIRKGHQYIIETLKNFKDSAFVFVIVGSGDYLHHYEEQCKEEIAEKRLFLLGNRTDIYELLTDSDIFLFPTLNENHSMALLEAINMHCAAIVTNVGGNTETIKDGETGIVIRPKNAADIVSALYRMKDKEKRKIYTQAAYAFSQVQFSVENTLGKLEILFNE